MAGCAADRQRHLVLDESEHSGAPDIITIRAHAADLGGEIRKRTEKSWHDTSLGTILATLAKRNKLTHKGDANAYSG